MLGVGGEKLICFKWGKYSVGFQPRDYRKKRPVWDIGEKSGEMFRGRRD